MVCVFSEPVTGLTIQDLKVSGPPGVQATHLQALPNTTTYYTFMVDLGAYYGNVTVSFAVSSWIFVIFFTGTSSQTCVNRIDRVDQTLTSCLAYRAELAENAMLCRVLCRTASTRPICPLRLWPSNVSLMHCCSPPTTRFCHLPQFTNQLKRADSFWGSKHQIHPAIQPCLQWLAYAGARCLMTCQKLISSGFCQWQR